MKLFEIYKQIINESAQSQDENKNINSLPVASYMMAFPFTMSTENPNNVWMKDYKPKDLKIDKVKLYKQFLDLYNYVSSDSIVWLLPHEGGFQDQVYVANVGITLPHKEMTAIAANYTSEPRIGEENIFISFMRQIGYDVQKSPYNWEGEADLKHLYDNKFIGGYGIRSDKKTYEWMTEQYDMDIIDVKMTDEYLYHLDCSIFPIDEENTLVCTDVFSNKEIKRIEKVTNIIDVDVDSCYNGITNSVRMYNTILCASNIDELDKKTSDYKTEKAKVDRLQSICDGLGMEPVFFNISEFYKSGAALSCMFLHLNRFSFKNKLI